MEKVAFLNGTLGFQDAGHRKYFNKLNSEGVDVMVVDNLFSQPQKMRELMKYDTWVVGSTGFEKEKLNKLFDAFEEMRYIPETVIFAPDIEPFTVIANALMGMTYFYRLNYINLTIEPLNYLNE